MPSADPASTTGSTSTPPRLIDLATGLAFPESPTVLTDGSILFSEVAAGRISSLNGDGVVETHAVTGGGPNGILPIDGEIYVCQNGGSSWAHAPWPYDLPGAAVLFRPVGPAPDPVVPQIQRVEAEGTVSTLFTTFRGLDGTRRDLVRPSDICGDGAGGFYVTDGGTTRGRSRVLTGLLHWSPGGELTEVVYPLEMPNGVALSIDGCSLYLAETRTRRVWSFDLAGPGRIAGGRGFATVPSGGPLDVGGADGVCVSPDGCVVVATLGAGGITVFDPRGRLVLAVAADDPMTTNATIDVDRDRLIMSLASSGRLVALEGWSRLLAEARETS